MYEGGGCQARRGLKPPPTISAAKIYFTITKTQGENSFYSLCAEIPLLDEARQEPKVWTVYTSVHVLLSGTCCSILQARKGWATRITLEDLQHYQTDPSEETAATWPMHALEAQWISLGSFHILLWSSSHLLNFWIIIIPSSDHYTNN